MMFEPVPLWMALVFGVVAAIIVECCLYCWNYTAIQYYKDLAADRMAEIADVRQANIELRHKVDELIDSNRDSLDKLDAYRSQEGRTSTSINDMLETIARYRNELRDANAKIEGLEKDKDYLSDLNSISNDKLDQLINEAKQVESHRQEDFDYVLDLKKRIKIADERQEDLDKQIRDLRAQVEMHRTNAAKAQDEAHRLNLHYNRLDAHLDDANEYLAACTESLVDIFKEIKDVHTKYKPALAPVNSGLAGAGPMPCDPTNGPGNVDREESECTDVDAEPPQICS